MKKTKENIIFAADVLLSFTAAFVIIFICSKSSPLYPLNDWVDANTYHTLGRGMLHGKVPYRDLYEQKGPLLYLLHALAAAISGNSFFGVFIIEAAAAGAFLLITARMLRKEGRTALLWLVPLIGTAVYSSKAFCHGDSAEELCLPLTLAAYLFGRQAAMDGKPLTDRQRFVSGVLAACVLWIKYTFLGVFMAAFAADMIVTVRKKDVMSAIRGAALYVLGAAAASAAVLAYFAVNGAVDDVFSVYFYDNIFRYPSEGSFFHHLADGWNFSRIFMTVPFCIICAALVLMPVKHGVRGAVWYAGSVLVMSLTVFGGHDSYQYYPLAMAVFLPEAVCVLCECAAPLFEKLKLPERAIPFVAAASIVLSGGLCYKLSRNLYLMKYDRDELPQYKFAEIMEERGGGSVLNYGFIDGGFYLAAEQVPEFRYFCLNNMEIPEMVSAQEHYVSSGRAHFVVARSETPDQPEYFTGYDLISTAELSYYDKYLYYFLFEINESNKNFDLAIE